MYENKKLPHLYSGATKCTLKFVDRKSIDKLAIECDALSWPTFVRFQIYE